MGKILDRFIRLNGPFFARVFRELAHQLDLIAPGETKLALVLFIHQKEISVAELTISDEVAELTASVKFFDAKGADATPDGTPTWSSSDETVATLTAADDGLSATLTVGTPGVALIAVSSQETDNESGEPYELLAQGTLTVNAGDAVIGSVEFSQN